MRNPFHVEPLRNAILRREAKSWLEAHFGDLITQFNLTRRSLSPRDAAAVRVAFLNGADTEMSRLTRATTVNLRDISRETLIDGAKQWWRQIKNADVDTCSLTEWRNLMLNSFEMGAEFVSHYLFPPPEDQLKTSPKRKRRR